MLQDREQVEKAIKTTLLILLHTYQNYLVWPHPFPPEQIQLPCIRSFRWSFSEWLVVRGWSPKIDIFDNTATS